MFASSSLSAGSHLRWWDFLTSFLAVVFFAVSSAFVPASALDSNRVSNTPTLVAQVGTPSAVVSVGMNPTVGALVQEINSATESEVLGYDESTGILSFDNVAYSQINNLTRREYMELALSTVRSSQLENMTKNKMFNFIADQDTATSSVIRNLQTDTKADIATSTGIFRTYVAPIVSVLFGLFAIFTLLFLSIVTCFDLAFIAIPPFRLFMTDKQSEAGRERPFLVSIEAIDAIKKAESQAGSANSKPAVLMYMKARFLIFFLLGLCVMLVITGQMYTIIGFFVDVFTPLLDTMKGV